MKVLALDTATERCSVALEIDGVVFERSTQTARAHAELVLPMVDSVLAEGGVTLRDLDGIAYGRGPGAFTGVRITIGVVQGLGFGAQRMTVGISNLAAVAQQVATPGDRVLVCMDARMGEVYWAVFECDVHSGLVEAIGTECVTRPENVAAAGITVCAGTGFSAYPQLTTAHPSARVLDQVLPHARQIAKLGAAALRAGKGVVAAAAQPVYLRDQVTFVKEK
jgi:tRNA threonylcarbamoyladenosine biosynthesis protein TsaB